MTEQEESKEENSIIPLTNRLLMAVEEERKLRPSLTLQEVINAIWFLSYYLQDQALGGTENYDK